MSSPYEAIARAVAEARILNQAVECSAYEMSRLLVPHLRHGSAAALAEMKRELHHFDSRTLQWKK